MKQQLSPAATAIIIVVVLAILIGVWVMVYGKKKPAATPQVAPTGPGANMLIPPQGGGAPGPGPAPAPGAAPAPGPAPSAPPAAP